MEINSLDTDVFKKYGHPVCGYDFTELLEVLVSSTDRPINSVIYEPSDEKLQGAEITASIRDGLFGGIPIQLGYCNGNNNTLNCLEYHRGCEVIVSVEGAILLVAPMQEIRNNTLDTSKVEAFLLPAGNAVLIYETSLHYAPCNAPGNNGFRTIVALPRNTNTKKPDIVKRNDEDKLLFARNKWLIAHPDSPEAKQGAYVGLSGINIKL